jgi:hypothetical protein
MLEVFSSRSGSPSIRINGVTVHSAYDPGLEARRFMENSLEGGRPSLVVILGEGLGYLSRRVRDAFPDARILRIHYSAEVFQASTLPSVGSGASASGPGSDTWHPGLGQDLAEFFRARIAELDLEGMRVLEWPPSAKIFPEQSRAANEALQQCIRELNGSFVTTMAMGRLWLRNTLCNFLSLEEALTGAPCSRERLVVIAASGPSLEQAAPMLRGVRDRADIWALPSSAPFLNSAGLEPDLVVMTDPGFYGIHHLRHAASGCPVAMPLSASRGLWTLRTRTGADSGPPRPYLLAQPGLLEEEFLRALGVDAPKIAPHGTVAATALDLALASTRGPVVLAGLDMCTDDILSHARPNEFEVFYSQQSSRTLPCYSLWYRRSADQDAARIPGGGRARAPIALRTYAGWLSGEAEARRGEVYRLLPSAVGLPGMMPLDAATLEQVVRRCPASPPGPQFAGQAALPSGSKRLEAARGILAGWRKTLAGGLKAARGPAGHTALSTPSVYALAYQFSAQLLMETKRKARLVGGREARDSAVRLLEECSLFLQELEGKVTHAA